MPSPDHFPAAFHNALHAGGLTIGLYKTKEEAIQQVRRFRAFLQCLRGHPQHVLNCWLDGSSARTRISQLPDGQWQVCVVVKKKLEWREKEKDFSDK